MSDPETQEEIFTTDCFPGFSVGSGSIEQPARRGFAFSLVPTTQTFDHARETCLQQESSEIASIHSQEEFDLAKSLLEEATALDAPSNTIDIWIGLKDDVFDDPTPVINVERFAWLDGSDFDFGTQAEVNPWQPGEPNNFRNETQEDCVVYNFYVLVHSILKYCCFQIDC